MTMEPIEIYLQQACNFLYNIARQAEHSPHLRAQLGEGVLASMEQLRFDSEAALRARATERGEYQEELQRLIECVKECRPPETIPAQGLRWSRDGQVLPEDKVGVRWA